MTHVPPTEPELQECLRAREAIDHHVVMRFAAEIRRLRELCGRAIPYIHLTPDHPRAREFRDELFCASKGEV